MNSTEQPGFAEAWERNKPYMVAALKKSGDLYEISDLLAMIEKGRAIFYPVENGAAVFRVVVYPKRTRLNLWLIGGEVGAGVAKLDAVMEAAEFLAKEHGCDGIECIGQVAYKRVLKPHGYKQNGVVLTRELGD